MAATTMIEWARLRMHALRPTSLASLVSDKFAYNCVPGKTSQTRQSLESRSEGTRR